MKNKLRLLSLLTLGSIALTGCNVDLGFIKVGEAEKTDNESNNNTNNNGNKEDIKIYDAEAQQIRINEYYSSIDTNLSGESLLAALKSLNLSKRVSEVGWENMSTSSAGKYKFTDYDPAYVKFNDKGIPYGTRVLSFYSGKSVTTFNREHVWPTSRGGNLVENDIYMPRPTVNEENSDRGNSVYLTGMVTEHNGWDPVAAFANNIGVYEGIRGECARIVFYCMTATSGLVLGETTNQNRNNMGVLSDLIEWACENPVNDREKRRQVGGEYLQGNRNAFVDHPEYACRIWGTHSSRTRTACQKANYPVE